MASERRGGEGDNDDVDDVNDDCVLIEIHVKCICMDAYLLTHSIP